MTIAGSIILIMLGAILTWAVDYNIAGLDINIVGVILMLGGLAGLLFGVYRVSMARRTVVVDREEAPVAQPGARRVVTERRYDDPRI
ncbi:hypothetical protein Misp01_10400 [Microtetraspora sp. NBRC 13810]|uniref:DUF6458 family protein n=1 Tax=Microtetraspora sp. NBRC 13810 TaxID=3030990 RepID=UPI0024A5A2F5|nr:DUF6458 family protein [Microtetraspora sp. NBRC 13810]GLW05910.1 hypothetical protein Misp01_10400 [Microtetraspora sp. NBRC 13810]